MSFVLDALRKSAPKGVAPAADGLVRPAQAERRRASGFSPWLAALAVLAAIGAGAAARSWSRHLGTAAAPPPVVAQPSSPAPAPAGIAPLELSRSMAASPSRRAAPPLASERQAHGAGRAEVPAALREEPPRLAISGYILDNAAGSLAIIDGKVLRVGDEAAPDLRIEKIDADGVTFDYRGYRFKRR